MSKVTTLILSDLMDTYKQLSSEIKNSSSIKNKIKEFADLSYKVYCIKKIDDFERNLWHILH